MTAKRVDRTARGRARRGALLGLALSFVAVALLLPLGVVVHGALRDGLGPYFDAVTSDETKDAIGLTLLAAGIAVPANLLFGIGAAWAITKLRVRGRRFLVTLIDLPFAISPVISGMMFILLFGADSWLAPWLDEAGLRVVFAPPGIVLATTFVTFPFVAREILPVMQSQGVEQELASLSLGASGWQTLFRVTLPSIRWALLYGTILSAARAVGEFGAVSVVSGHVRGETNTATLHVEALYGEYQFQAAFAVATLLVGLAFVTLLVKAASEWRAARANPA